jgi:hypothetical protein
MWMVRGVALLRFALWADPSVSAISFANLSHVGGTLRETRERKMKLPVSEALRAAKYHPT